MATFPSRRRKPTGGSGSRVTRRELFAPFTIAEARRRRGRATLVIAAVVAAACALYSASVGLPDTSPARSATPTTRRARASARTPARTAARAGAIPGTLQVATHTPRAGWTVVARVGGVPATWLARRAGVTLMRVDQRLVHLVLHAGSSDGGTAGWTYGDRITAGEAPLLIAAVNGGFKLTYTNVGFVSRGHVAAPLKAGLASLVTYSDGSTNIGSWHAGVPSARTPVFSVLQNQHLLVDHGLAAANVSSCVIECWGGTIGLQTEVARSALGITASGQLVWAAGEHLSPSALASALIGAGAVRAIELDINPWWVAGYLYPHRPSVTSHVRLVPGQRGVAGAFFKPYTRDFLTFVAN